MEDRIFHFGRHQYTLKSMVGQTVAISLHPKPRLGIIKGTLRLLEEDNIGNKLFGLSGYSFGFNDQQVNGITPSIEARRNVFGEEKGYPQIYVRKGQRSTSIPSSRWVYDKPKFHSVESISELRASIGTIAHEVNSQKRMLEDRISKMLKDLLGIRITQVEIDHAIKTVKEAIQDYCIGEPKIYFDPVSHQINCHCVLKEPEHQITITHPFKEEKNGNPSKIRQKVT